VTVNTEADKTFSHSLSTNGMLIGQATHLVKLINDISWYIVTCLT